MGAAFSKNKDEATHDHYAMVKNSCTFARMTYIEKERLNHVYCNAHQFVSGNYRQRWQQLNGMYAAFLYALGYYGGDWREPDTV